MYNAEIFLNNKLSVRCLTILIVFQEEEGRMELTPHIDVIQNANDLNYNKSTNKYSLEKLTLYCIVLVCHFFWQTLYN